MNQLAFILPAPAARRRDPETSKAAANRALEFASGHHARIFEALQAPGTIYELGERCGLNHVAVARRLPEMLKAGLAEPTEDKRDGCRVWRRKV